MTARCLTLSLISHSSPLLVLPKHDRNILEPLGHLMARSMLRLLNAYCTPLLEYHFVLLSRRDGLLKVQHSAMTAVLA